MLSVAIFLVTCSVTIVVSAYFDWLVHSDVVMHSKKKLPRMIDVLRADHPDHHKDFPVNRPQNPDHPPGRVYLPIWAGVISVGSLPLTSLPVAFYLNMIVISVSVAIASSLYFMAHNRLHTRYHMPKHDWFEKRRFFRHMLKYHLKHHALYGQREGNYAVVLPIFDHVYSTVINTK